MNIVWLRKYIFPRAFVAVIIAVASFSVQRSAPAVDTQYRDASPRSTFAKISSVK